MVIKGLSLAYFPSCSLLNRGSPFIALSSTYVCVRHRVVPNERRLPGAPVAQDMQLQAVGVRARGTNGCMGEALEVLEELGMQTVNESMDAGWLLLSLIKISILFLYSSDLKSFRFSTSKTQS